MTRSDNLQPDAAARLSAAGVGQRDGALVVVQPAVLATVDHAFGNLFQRLYHLVRTARNGSDGPLAALEESLHELQSLLELLVDYVVPTPSQTRTLPATDVLLSCRRHLDDEIGPGRVDLRSGELSGVLVAIDPGLLGRVFQLVARALHRAAGKSAVRGCGAVFDSGGQFEIRFEPLPGCGGASDELRWALAEKLVDLQGGELHERIVPDGVQRTLRLPVWDS